MITGIGRNASSASSGEMATNTAPTGTTLTAVSRFLGADVQEALELVDVVVEDRQQPARAVLEPASSRSWTWW